MYESEENEKKIIIIAVKNFIIKSKLPEDIILRIKTNTNQSVVGLRERGILFRPWEGASLLIQNFSGKNLAEPKYFPQKKGGIPQFEKSMEKKDYFQKKG